MHLLPQNQRTRRTMSYFIPIHQFFSRYFKFVAAWTVVVISLIFFHIIHIFNLNFVIERGHLLFEFVLVRKSLITMGIKKKKKLKYYQTLLVPISTFLTISKDTKVVLKILEIFSNLKFITTTKYPNSVLNNQMGIYISIIKEVGSQDLVKTIDKFGQP